MKRFASEFLGTFILVFIGAGAIVVNDVSGAVTHVGISLVFGLVVLALVYTLGDVSGAHINPAVTLGFLAAGRFEGRGVIPYLSAQFLGGIAASLMLRAMFPDQPTLGGTLPAHSALQAFVMEVMLTFILMFVVLSVSTGPKEKGITAGIAVGSVIAFEALMGGPVSGASMNPARSFGPALVSMHLESIWIYLSAPVLGALLGVVAGKVVLPEIKSNS
jgi:aquaporin Z